LNIKGQEDFHGRRERLRTPVTKFGRGLISRADRPEEK